MSANDTFLDTESRRPGTNTGQGAYVTILRQESLLSQNLFLPWSVNGYYQIRE